MTPIVFLGIADHMELVSSAPFIPSIDLLRISKVKTHIIYPAVTNGYRWIFALGKELIHPEPFNAFIRLTDESDQLLQEIQLKPGSPLRPEKPSSDGSAKPGEMAVFGPHDSAILLPIEFDTLINRPGTYFVEAKWEGTYVKIGEVLFTYQETLPLTPDQIRAIESNADSNAAVCVNLGCKLCPKVLKIYSAIERQPSLQAEGYIWQYDAPDEFVCDCGKTSYPLQYVKNGLHGLLLKGMVHGPSMAQDYRRNYTYERILEIVTKFNELLEDKKDEKSFQTYIENNLVMLAVFRAEIISVKSEILGKYQTDFVILDSQSRLLLIEIEKPSTKLFKANNHPTQHLMHAYEQVRDWLHEYEKHPAAFLEGLKLKPSQVVAVRGIVIAGRTRDCSYEARKRHLATPLYPNIEFLTFDDLSRSLLEISKKLV